MPLQVKSLAEWEREGIADMLSVVIPAHNEELTIAFFGLRFSRGGRVVDYSRPKPLLNRNDISNAFEIYRRTVIGGIQPRLAQHFNLSFDPTLAKKSSRSFRCSPGIYLGRRWVVFDGTPPAAMGSACRPRARLS